jgi:hypothetical protein
MPACFECFLQKFLIMELQPGTGKELGAKRQETALNHKQGLASKWGEA